MANNNYSPSLTLIVICAALVLSTAPPPAARGDHHRQLATAWIPTAITTTMKPQCKGSFWECMVEGDENEFELDSESNRRILATNQYISYGALQRNTVPCSRRGASYYNCRPGAQANPYGRGCSAITRCRG